MSDQNPPAGAPPAVPSSDTGANKHKGNRGGRGFRRAPPAQPKFEGKTEALKGFIFDYGDPKQSDLYTQSKKELAEYVGRTMTYGNDISNSITKLALSTVKLPDEPQPIPPATVLSKAQDKIYDKELVEYVKRKIMLETNVNTLYNIVWGQCTDALREKLKALSTYSTMSTKGEGINLLVEIRDLVYKREKDKDAWHSYYEATLQLYVFRQGNNLSNEQYHQKFVFLHGNNLSNEQYHQKFQNLVEYVDGCGGGLGNVKTLQTEMLQKIAATPGTPTADEVVEAKTKARERFYATMFFLRADKDRFGVLQRKMYNDKLQGTDNYPNTIIEAYHLMVNWQPEFKPRSGNNATNDGVAFANMGSNDHKDISTVKCFNCNEMGHYSSSCPKPPKKKKGQDNKANDEGYQMLHAGFNDF
jgi:Zinc knuckle